MVRLPVSIPVPSPKRGDDASYWEYRARRELADKVEAFLNATPPGDNSTEYDYGLIAQELKVEKQSIRDLLYPVDGGSNGITVYWPHGVI